MLMLPRPDPLLQHSPLVQAFVGVVARAFAQVIGQCESTGALSSACAQGSVDVIAIATVCVLLLLAPADLGIDSLTAFR